jgi:hypothetical protein
LNKINNYPDSLVLSFENFYCKFKILSFFKIFFENNSFLLDNKSSSFLGKRVIDEFIYINETTSDN